VAKAEMGKRKWGQATFHFVEMGFRGLLRKRKGTGTFFMKAAPLHVMASPKRDDFL
jgi:hypothetical protein